MSDPLNNASEIAELRRAKVALEEALAATRKSDEQSRTMLAMIPTLVWRATAEGAAEFFSQRWYEYTGMSFEEAQGDEGVEAKGENLGGREPFDAKGEFAQGTVVPGGRGKKGENDFAGGLGHGDFSEVSVQWPAVGAKTSNSRWEDYESREREGWSAGSAAAPAIPVRADQNAGAAPRRLHSSWTAWYPR